VVFVVDAEVFALLLDTYMHGVSPPSIAPINYRWLPTTIRLHRPLLSLALTVVVAVAVASMTVASTLLLRIELVADLKAI
jgi:hypothetical protein